MLKRNVCWLGLLVVVSLAPAVAAADEDPGGFVDAIGVNTHVCAVSTAYGDLARVVGALAYLGIRHVRDNPPADASPRRYRALEQAGIGLELVARSGEEPDLRLYDQLAGGLDGIEGANEVNAHPDSLLYRGLAGFPAAFLLQSNLYDRVKADSELRGVPVAMFSAVYHSAADLPPYPGAAGKADLANVHAYPPGAASPPDVYLAGDIARWARAVPGAPVLLTEFGYFTWPAAPRHAGVDERTQAQWTLAALADNFFVGHVKRQYIYELVDQMPDSGAPDKEHHFGLFTVLWKPKPAAVAIHNLGTILGDAGATAPPAIVLSGLAPTAHAGFLKTSQGRLFLLLWDEPGPETTWQHPEASAAPVVVKFPQDPGPVQLYDPLRSAAPVQSFHGTAKPAISLSGDLMVLTWRQP